MILFYKKEMSFYFSTIFASSTYFAYYFIQFYTILYNFEILFIRKSLHCQKNLRRKKKKDSPLSSF